jgi:hypothetical protein
MKSYGRAGIARHRRQGQSATYRSIMALSQRPLTLGEILDRTVQLYRQNFLLLAGISSVPAALMVLIFGGAGLLISRQITSLKPDPAGMLAFGLILTAAVLIGIPIMVAAFALALSASNHAVLHIQRGEKTTIRASYGYAFQHFWRHLWLLFLQAAMAWLVPYLVFVGIVVVGIILGVLAARSGAAVFFVTLLVVVGILLALALMVVCVLIWLRFCLGFAVSVAEESPAWAAMMRSGRLTKGSRGRIFVMFLLVYALSIAVSLALMIPLFILIAVLMRKQLAGTQPPPSFIIAIEAVNFCVSFLVRAFVMPVYSTALMLFYFDQRTRHEGYDIEQLMAQAGYSQLPPALPPYPEPYPAPPPAYPIPPGYPPPLPALEYPPPVAPVLAPPEPPSAPSPQLPDPATYLPPESEA